MDANYVWPEWKIVRLIGEGSFGKVYEIQREEYGIVYKSAMKVITIPSNQSEIQSAYSKGLDKKGVTEYFHGYVEDLTREFALMAKLRGCNNIVSYEDHKVCEHSDGIGWDILIRMEFLTPLQKWSSQHPLNEAGVIKLGIDICNALELCQQEKIIHRDIKPENIFINDYGFYKLGDFGIARIVDSTASDLSRKGTYNYIAPEIYTNKSYGCSVDIYSLGLVLYGYLNENRLPFLPVEGPIRYTDSDKAFQKRMEGDPIPPPVRGSNALKNVILKAIAYEPGERFATAAEFKKAIEDCVKEIGVSDSGTVRLFPFEEKTAMSLPKRQTKVIHSEVEPNKDVKKELNRKKWGMVPILGIVAVLAVGLVLFVRMMEGQSFIEDVETMEDTSSITSTTTDCYITGEPTVISIGETTDLAFNIGEYIYRHDDSLAWISNDIAIATVDDRGVVTGISAGTVRITGTFDGLEAIIDITVEETVTQDNREDSIPEASATSEISVDSLEIQCYTDILLVGDSINIWLKADNWILEGNSGSIKWSISDSSIAAINEEGILTAHTAGICDVIAEYGGKMASQEIMVVDVDNSSGAIVTADYEKISLGSGGRDTVYLTFDGNVPEYFGATAYYSAGMFLQLEWGELNNNSVSLTVGSSVRTDEKEGYITVLVYDQADINKIIASTKIHVRIN